MAILVSRGDQPAYLVYTHAEYRNGQVPEPQADYKPRVRVKMGRRDPIEDAKNRITVHDLEISVRSLNALVRDGIEYAWQVAAMSDNEIRRILGVGEKNFNDIKHGLREAGF
jgi:DNA-directed RNA polymerase alpha subunit